MQNNFLSFSKIIIIILLSQVLGSCKIFRPSFKEPSKYFKKDLKDASPDFKQGWADGCETGMSGGGNSFQQTMYKVNKQDGYKFSYSPDYKVAWNYAFWFCYRADYVDQKSTPFSSMFKGYN
jgi:hypothetical protein